MLGPVLYIVVATGGDDSVAENIVNCYVSLFALGASDFCFNHNGMLWWRLQTMKWWMCVQDMSFKVSN